MKLFEKVMIIVAVAALLLKAFDLPLGDLLLSVSCSLLSIIYFLFGFALFNAIRFRKMFKKDSYAGISARRIIAAIGFGWFLSSIIIGIMLKLLFLPGGNLQIASGLIIGLLVMVISLIFYKKKKKEFFFRVLARALPIALIGLIIWAIPTGQLIDFFERKNPERANEVKENLNT